MEKMFPWLSETFPKEPDRRETGYSVSESNELSKKRYNLPPGVPVQERRDCQVPEKHSQLYHRNGVDVWPAPPSDSIGGGEIIREWTKWILFDERFPSGYMISCLFKSLGSLS
jgi:hypothetical protein